MAIERNVVDFKIHNLTEEQFQELKAQGKIDPNAVYCTPDMTKERLDALETKTTSLESKTTSLDTKTTLLENNKQDKGDYATNTALSEGLSQKQDVATAINYDNITNCITEIPQDIKLELANGVLTLKAGSKVYVPNGAGVFDAEIVNVDIPFALSVNNTYMLFKQQGKDIIDFIPKESAYSGPNISFGDGYGDYVFGYDTESNSCGLYENDGKSHYNLIRNESFPICIFTVSNGAISSIDQVFNGFGYIGSTVFALPGVKGLVPNGRNADGTLKNGIVTLNEVSTFTRSGNFDKWGVYISSGGKLYTIINSFVYNEHENIIRNATDNTPFGVFQCGTATSVDNKISLQPKTTFHAVDYNDFEALSDTVETLSDTVEVLSETVETNNDNAVHKTDFENTVEELNSSISAVDSSVVHKTGDETVGGTKTFTAPSLKISNEAGNGGTGLKIHDSNGKGQTSLNQFYVGGQYYSRLESHNTTANKISYVEVVVHDDGQSRFSSYNVDNMYAPTPVASSNGTNIATTAFVKSVLSSSGNGLATFSKGASGYYKFNNGLIIQWGQSAGDAVPRTITMPTAFTGAATFEVFVQPLVEGTTYNFYQPGVDNASKTTTTFKVYSSGYVAGTGWYWVAIGY